ncbi:MAG: hypothetical protein WCT15_05420, partial [Candidatus Omnitrophota bacterium]
LAQLGSYVATGGAYTTGQWNTVRATMDASNIIRVSVVRNTALGVYTTVGTYTTITTDASCIWTTGKVAIGSYTTNNTLSFANVGAGTGTPPAQLTRQPHTILNALPQGSLVPVKGDWRFVDDGTGDIKYIQMTPSIDSMASLKGLTVSSGTVKTDFRLTKDSSNALLYFGLDQNMTGYAARVVRNATYYTVSFLNISYGKIGSQVGTPVNLYDLDRDQYHTLNVGINGTIMTAWLDNRQTPATMSAIYTTGSAISGTLGIGSTLASVMPALFDNFGASNTVTVSDSNAQIPEANFAPQSGTTWAITDGEYANTSRYPGTGANTLAQEYQYSVLQGYDNFKDGTIETDIELNKLDVDSGSAIFFRMDSTHTANNNGYMLRITYNSIQLYQVYNQFTTLSAPSYSSATITNALAYGAKYHLKVTISGNTLRADINGSTLNFNSLDTTSYPSEGSIYVASYRCNGPAAPIIFDNFVLDSSLMVPDAEKEGFVYKAFTPADDGGNWQMVSDGVEHGTVYEQSKTGVGYHMAIMEGYQTQNGAIQTQFKFNNPIDGDRILLYSRLDDSRNGYAACVEKSGANVTLSLYNIVAGAVSGGSLDTAKTFSNFDFSAWHTLNIIMSDDLVYGAGKRLKAVLDGNQTNALQYANSAIIVREGKVAIGTGDIDGTVWFDNAGPVDPIQVGDDLSTLYDMSFTPATGNWGIVDDGTGNMVYGQLSPDNTPATHYASFLHNMKVEDGLIEMNVKIEVDPGTTPARNEDAFVYFRMDEANQHGYALKLNKAGNVVLYKVQDDRVGSSNNGINNSDTDVTYYKSLGNEFTLSGFSINAYHKIKIELAGAVIKISVDGIERTWNDTSYYGSSYAKVGIGTNETTKRILFDNVIIKDATMMKDTLSPAKVPTLDVLTGTWKFIEKPEDAGNFAYCQTRADTNATNHHAAFLKDTVARDGSAEASVKFDAASAQGQANLYFRMNSSNATGYAVTLNRSNSALTLSKVMSGINNSSYTALDSVTLTVDDWSIYHTIKVTFDVSTIKVYFDGILWIEKSDLAYYDADHYRTGIATSETTGMVWFDDVKAVDSLYSKNTFTKTNTSGYTPAAIDGTWSFVEDQTGNMAYIQTQVDSTYHLSKMNGLIAQSGTIQADIRVDGTTANDRGVLYFRMSSNYTTGGYAAAITGDKKLRILERSNSADTSRAEVLLTDKLPLFNPKEFHSVKVVFSGTTTTTIKVYVDGVDCLTWSDTATPYYGASYQYAGVGTYYLSAPVWFDNIGPVDSNNNIYANDEFDMPLYYGNLVFDLDGSGIVDANDENVILDYITAKRYEVSCDLDGDYDVDYFDLDLMRRDYASSTEVSAKTLDGKTYFVTEDKNLDRIRVEDHQGNLYYSDVTGKRVTGINGIDYWLVDTDEGLYGLKLKELKRSDLNDDKKVDGSDFDIMHNAMGSSYISGKNGSEYSTTTSSTNWKKYTDPYYGVTTDPYIYAQASGAAGTYVSYDLSVPQGGAYKIGLSVMNNQAYVDGTGTAYTWRSRRTGPSLPEGYRYEFKVYIDNVYMGPLFVNGMDNEFSMGTMLVNMTDSGAHKVKFEWANPAPLQAAGIQTGTGSAIFANATIGKVAIESVDYDERADLNADNVVDRVDLEMFIKEYGDSGLVQRLELDDGTSVYAIKDEKSGQYYFYNEDGAEFIPSLDGTSAERDDAKSYEGFSAKASTPVVGALSSGFTTDSWVSQNQVSRDRNGFAFQSGSVAAGASSYIEEAVNIIDDAILTFAWRIASVSSDVLRLEIIKDSTVTVLAQRTRTEGTDW